MDHGRPGGASTGDRHWRQPQDGAVRHVAHRVRCPRQHVLFGPAQARGAGANAEGGVGELAQAPDADAQRLVATGGTASNLPLVLSRRNPPNVLTTADLLTCESRLDSGRAVDVARKLQLPPKRIKAMRAGLEELLLLLDWYGWRCSTSATRACATECSWRTSSAGTTGGTNQIRRALPRPSPLPRGRCRRSRRRGPNGIGNQHPGRFRGEVSAEPTEGGPTDGNQHPGRFRGEVSAEPTEGAQRDGN